MIRGTGTVKGELITHHFAQCPPALDQPPDAELHIPVVFSESDYNNFCLTLFLNLEAVFWLNQNITLGAFYLLIIACVESRSNNVESSGCGINHYNLVFCPVNDIRKGSEYRISGYRGILNLPLYMQDPLPTSFPGFIKYYPADISLTPLFHRYAHCNFICFAHNKTEDEQPDQLSSDVLFFLSLPDQVQQMRLLLFSPHPLFPW